MANEEVGNKWPVAAVRLTLCGKICSAQYEIFRRAKSIMLPINFDYFKKEA